MLYKDIVVYTIGHSNRGLGEFVEILCKYRIQVIIDVRRFPVSTKYPWFNREVLEDKLKCEDIEYVWLGDLLGGYRKGGYEKYMDTESFKMGIKNLLSIITNKNSAILCSEKLWFKCHRRFISDVLKGLGFNIVHIIDKDKVYLHKRAREIE